MDNEQRSDEFKNANRISIGKIKSRRTKVSFNTNGLSLLSLWGKTTGDTPNSLYDFYPAVYHMADVMVFGQELARTSAFRSVFNKIWQLIRLEDFSSHLHSNNNISFEKNNFSEEKEVQSFVWFLFAMHDLGKISPHFQNRGGSIITTALERYGFPINFTSEKSNHPGLGMKLFSDLSSSYQIPRRVKSIIRKIILGHHGRFDVQNSEEHQVIKNEWRSIRQNIWNLFLEILDCHPNVWNKIQIKHASIVGISLQSLLVLADWLASNEELFHWQSLNQIPSEGDLKEILQQHIEEARVQAKAVLEKMGFITRFSDFLPENVTLRTLFAQNNFTNLFPIQKLSDRLTGQEKIVILEAPMGDGKTEAALTIAGKMMVAGRNSRQSYLSGFYIALPTTATSNQMYHRIQEFLKNSNPAFRFFTFYNQLVHGRSWIVDKLTMTKSDVFGSIDPHHQDVMQDYFDAIRWFEPKRRALLSPLAVGTIDQSLMSVLNVKFGFLRLLGLAGKILIVDEVHAYDAYMMEIFDRLLEWAAVLDIPLILLSATLPENKKEHIFNHYLEAKQKYGVLDSVLDGVLNGLDQQFHSNQSIGQKNDELLEIPESGSDIPLEPYPMISFVDSEGNIGSLTEDPSISLEQKTYRICNLPGTEGNVFRMGSVIVNTLYKILKSQDVPEHEKNFGCHCVLINTVSTAQELYKMLKEVLDGSSSLRESWVPKNTQVLLFHSRYTVKDRNLIENQVKKYFGKALSENNGDGKLIRPANTILVATQVVEQSLDLDFDGMFTELAPIDLLVQRMGRVWRHSRQNRPTASLYPFPCIFIFGASFSQNNTVGRKIVEDNSADEFWEFFYFGPIINEKSWLNNASDSLDSSVSTDLSKTSGKILKITGKSRYVYSPYLLIRTQILLDALTQNGFQFEVKFPQDLRELIERVYQPKISFPPSPRGAKPCYLSSVQSELNDLFRKYKESEEKSSRQTLQYLIPPPVRDSYRYAEVYRDAFEEGEDHETKSKFKAKTRLIEDSCAVILIEEGSLIHQKYTQLENKTGVSKKWKEELLNRSLSIRYSSIENVKPEQGYEPICRTPKWMYGYFVIIAKSEPTGSSDSLIWEGINKEDELVKLKYTKEEGFIVQKIK
ncbi:MAG: hypothetical protein DRO88_10420 [Promethearchaeia archaeon]|nr:MAG: hypothetical protein DRO88_10420 [Candidatus Lokiarchaeia archaeon]